MMFCRSGLFNRPLTSFIQRPFNTSIKRTLRRQTKEAETNVKPFSRPIVEQKDLYPPAGWGSLIKPTLFTVGFSASVFGLAAIWQYENMRKKALEQKSKGVVENMWTSIVGTRKESTLPPDWSKATEWRKALNVWWNETLTEGQRVFVPILAINVLVFGLWKVPGFRNVMKKYFLASPSSPTNCWPMLFSGFSHFGLFHLFANMFVLHSFSTGIVHFLGKEQFVALYLSSAVFSCYCSYIFKIISGSTVVSLGASGAVYTVLGVFGTLSPGSIMQIVFLPVVQFSAATAIKGLLVMDTVGLIARWRLFDHAAHLGGLLLGIWYCHYGFDLFWKRREHLMIWWKENVRGKITSD